MIEQRIKDLSLLVNTFIWVIVIKMTLCLYFGKVGAKIKERSFFGMKGNCYSLAYF